MRFSTAHTTAILSMASCALAAILVSHTLGAASTLLLPTLFAMAALNAVRVEPFVVVPARVGGALSVALVVYCVTSLRSQADISSVASTFAGYLLVLRVLTRDSARSDIQLAVLSLFAFLSVALLSPSVDYGAFLLLFVLITPLALALTHLRGAVEKNERSGAKDKAGARVDLGRILRSKRVLNRHFMGLGILLVAPIVLGTLFVFFLFPRVGLAAVQLQLNNNRTRIGFATDVVLVGTVAPEQDSTVALRLRPPPGLPVAPFLGAYMRGAVATHDSTDGLRSDPAPTVPNSSDARCTKNLSHDLGTEALPLWTVDSVASEQPYLFLPLAHTRATLLKPENGCLVERATTHEVLSSTSGSGYRYVFTGDPMAGTQTERLSAESRQQNLALRPDTLRLLESVRAQFPNGASTHLTASGIEQQFRTQFQYDLASPSRQAEHPMEHFLTRSKRGHCEFFAAAMTLLLRDRGIPARVVTGYLGGEYNRYGAFYTFRQSDAHAWVEAYVDSEQRWLRFDPTPQASGAAGVPKEPTRFREFYEASSAVWQRYFVSYDLNRQQDLVDRASQRMGEAAGAAQGTGLLARARALSPKKLGAALAVFAAAALLWTKRGRIRRTQQQRALARVAAQGHQLERVLERAGYARSPHETLPAFARRVATSHPRSDALYNYARSYEEIRYGAADLSATRQSELRAWLREIRLS